MSKLRPAARHLPWLLFLGVLILHLASASRSRARADELDLAISDLEAEVRRLDTESVILRRELGRVRLDMAAREGPAPRNGS